MLRPQDYKALESARWFTVETICSIVPSTAARRSLIVDGPRDARPIDQWEEVTVLAKKKAAKKADKKKK